MTTTASDLAIEGGPKVRARPWPARQLFDAQELQAVTALFEEAARTGQPIGYEGPQETAYGREFAAYLGGGYADGVNSGSSAIWVALRALEIEPFTEVIVAPTSDQGSYMPVVLNNCIPVPADSRPGSHNTGPEQIAERITPQTSAIIVVHTAGYPVDMDPIVEMARARGIRVIEDCAQAHGAVYRGRMVGTIGDIGAFSTMFGKQHATGGQGGVVFTKDQNLYWRVRRSADRGKGFGLPAPPPDVRLNVIAAHNMNMDELHAAIGRVQLRRLPGFLAARRRFAARVAEGCRSRLATVAPEPPLEGCEASYWRVFFTLELDRLRVDKRTFVAALRAEGFPVESYRYPITECEWYRTRNVFGKSGYPWACPLYKGDPDRTYPLPNLDDADRRQFYVPIHEGCGDREADDLLSALAKLEQAFRR